MPKINLKVFENRGFELSREKNHLNIFYQKGNKECIEKFAYIMALALGINLWCLPGNGMLLSQRAASKSVFSSYDQTSNCSGTNFCPSLYVVVLWVNEAVVTPPHVRNASLNTRLLPLAFLYGTPLCNILCSQNYPISGVSDGSVWPLLLKQSIILNCLKGHFAAALEANLDFFLGNIVKGYLTYQRMKIKSMQSQKREISSICNCDANGNNMLGLTWVVRSEKYV